MDDASLEGAFAAGHGWVGRWIGMDLPGATIGC